MNNCFSTVKKSVLCLNKPVLNGLSLFLIGILLLGLLSCSSATEATEATSSTPTEDKTPPTTVTINSATLINGQSSYLSFIFSEEVTNFTPDDIQFNPDDAADKGSFTTNSLQKYLLEVTLKKEGALEVTIPANSFEDLHSNQNTEEFTNSFKVLPSTTTTHTISFILNGGKYTSPQITTLKVADGEAIDQTNLGEILSYPPTGPNLDYLPITREIYQWQTNGIEYDFSTPVSNDMILEAVWSNSCDKVETVHPKNRGELQAYVTNAIVAAPTTNLNHIDTSAITDMVDLFEKEETFNGEISCWNTFKVTNMNSMFSGANAFNQNIGTWDVSSVTDMGDMFDGAGAFNQNIGNWNVSSVTYMNNMFSRALDFNQNIGNWNVSSVTDMKYMFNRARAFNQNIGNWNVSSVTSMSWMFTVASAFDQDLSGWSVAAVTSHNNIFLGSPMAKPENADKRPKFSP